VVALETRRMAWLPILFVVLALSSLSWAIYSGVMPWEVANYTDVEMKEITSSGGEKVQIFVYGNDIYNATRIFGKIVDINKWQVRVSKLKLIYAGVEYPPQPPRFELISKE
jgi:hypothetical protein